jgi:molybdopterin converting factor small subunit
MRLTVRLYAGLRKFGPPGHEREDLTLVLPEGSTVASLLHLLGVPDHAPVVAMVGQRVVELEHALVEGDVVALFPPVAGG